MSRLVRWTQTAACLGAVAGVLAMLVTSDARWSLVAMTAPAIGAATALTARRAVLARGGSLRRLSPPGVVLASLSLGLGFLAVVAFGLYGLRTPDGRASDGIVYNDGTTVSSDALRTGLLAGALGTATGAVLLSRLGRKLDQRSVNSVLATDQRPPVVYLRSFGDDELRLARSASVRRSALDLLSLRPTERFEEVIAATITGHGPPIAFSDPRSTRRLIGVPRRAVSSDPDAAGLLEWQSMVLAWLDRARSAVLVAGSTPSLGWEIRTVLQRWPEKVRIVMPPDDAAGTARRIDVLRAAAATAGVDVPAYGSEDAAVGIVKHGSVVWLRADRRDESAYAVCLDAAEFLATGATADSTVVGVPSSRPPAVALGLATLLALVSLGRVDAALASGSTQSAVAATPEPDSGPDGPDQPDRGMQPDRPPTTTTAAPDPTPPLAFCERADRTTLALAAFQRDPVGVDPAIVPDLRVVASDCSSSFIIFAVTYGDGTNGAAVLMAERDGDLLTLDIGTDLDLERALPAEVAAAFRSAGW